MANGWRDSRFGQFADPNFGASLGMPSGQGVLPGGGPAPSASDDTSNGVISDTLSMPKSQIPGVMSPRSTGDDLIRAPGMPRDGASEAEFGQWRQSVGWPVGGGARTGGGGVIGPGPYLAEGGPVEDQDSGNAEQPEVDPFSIVKEALNYGRKAFGVTKLFGDTVRKGFAGADRQLKSATDKLAGGEPEETDPLARAVADEGGNAPPSDEERALTMNNALGGMGQDEGIQFGDTFVPGQQKDSINLAEGGEVPGDEEEPDGGVLQEAPQGGDQSKQSAMAYLSGKGGVTPDVAAAMEQQVDPRGQMDPSERKLAAIQATGSPEKAFGLMQHYRAKFNGYSAFAKAAIQGAGGRPPNGQAAAEALNNAYANVPDGSSMHFTPVRGGLQVQVRKLGGGKQRQPQRFEDGGEVDDDFQYETGGGQELNWQDRLKNSIGMQQYGPESTSRYASMAPTGPEDEEAQSYARPRQPLWENVKDVGRAIAHRDPSNQTQNFFIKLADALGWLDKGWDEAVDNDGAENSIPREGPEQAGASGGVTSENPQDPQAKAMMADAYGKTALSRTPNNGVPERSALDWRTPEVKDVVQEAIDKEPLLKAQLEFADRAYGGWASNQEKLNLAKAEIIKNHVKSTAGLEREKQRGHDAGERLDKNLSNKELLANLRGKYDMQKVEAQARAKAEHDMTQRYTRLELQQLKDTNRYGQMIAEQAGKNYRAALMSLADAEAAQGTLSHAPTPPAQNPAQPTPQPQPQGQAPQGQAPQATQGTGVPPPNPPPGMKYQTKGNQWRLVPAGATP